MTTVTNVRFPAQVLGSRRAAAGWQFQFAWSNCGRTSCIGCQPAPQDRERLLWRMGPFERLSAYGGCTLKPVICMAIFWQIGWLEVAGTVCSPSSLIAAVGQTRRSPRDDPRSGTDRGFNWLRSFS